MKKHPEPHELEPIERASRDELQALQLQRLRWTLQHAYDNVPHYRNAFDARGVHPSDCRTLADMAKFPFTAKADLRDQLPVRHVRRAARAGGARARQQRHHRQAHRGGLHARRHRPLGRPGGALDPRVGRARRRHRHVAYGYGLFTGGLGAHYGAERWAAPWCPWAAARPRSRCS
jgi:phenylacetate-CoA ligase